VSLSYKARQILQLLAEDYERDPTNHRSRGMSKRELGASIGAYLSYVVHEVEELRKAGFASRIKPLDINSNVVITIRGYRYIRPNYVRAVRWLAERKLIAIISLVVAVIGIIVGIVSLIK